jgi:hypothetical protein
MSDENLRRRSGLFLFLLRDTAAQELKTMTNTIPSLLFPDPSDQSLNPRAKRKWAPPTLTIEQVTHTAAVKAFVAAEGHTVNGSSVGPLS